MPTGPLYQTPAFNAPRKSGERSGVSRPILTASTASRRSVRQSFAFSVLLLLLVLLLRLFLLLRRGDVALRLDRLRHVLFESIPCPLGVGLEDALGREQPGSQLGVVRGRGGVGDRVRLWPGHELAERLDMLHQRRCRLPANRHWPLRGGGQVGEVLLPVATR